ncbi:MAG: hypothetical protein A2945_00360 [Candidatus Liptonbacteria bacterium RIFCSPLOWO2_01_FULL_52_25]|uniref:Gfo/Idh/MocA-like oxidoreductase N-terminal domain-containing protein n=1 Tax=Candidatus Liptonbacteria bacterium RIFCSPLOWO2_01_FULL_52_25 TaxID=1798650 RepID=A0A1G2CHD2_9BACT|nr:MAG: hypothetical protein A2945_00360 [Candidatus Liptonbacteria bacterium RIFCSPLOWO2_01_FULL_52_25]
MCLNNDSLFSPQEVQEMGIKEVVIVGTGSAFTEHYLGALMAMKNVRVVGVVEGALTDEVANHAVVQSAWKSRSIAEIPSEHNVFESIAIVLTPDHFPVIKELVERGFRRIAVEKPLVSRDWEVEEIKRIIEWSKVSLYATDFYIQKLLPLLIVTGVLTPNDPRYDFVKIQGVQKNHKELLGPIEGISVQIIEAGDFCLPDITKRPWLADNAEIGGMLRDLGTHIFAPLVTAGLITSDVSVHHVDMGRIDNDNKGLVTVRGRRDPELYVPALLTEHGIPLSIALGKVPFRGGIWTLVIRGQNGTFCAGLRTGQSSVLVSDKGEREHAVFSLKKLPYQTVFEEAFMYFDGTLPNFDGHLGAFFTSKAIEDKIRKYYL